MYAGIIISSTIQDQILRINAATLPMLIVQILMLALRINAGFPVLYPLEHSGAALFDFPVALY
jgi:hypothetical protein